MAMNSTLDSERQYRSWVTWLVEKVKGIDSVFIILLNCHSDCVLRACGAYSRVKPTYVRTWGLNRVRAYTRRGLICGRIGYNCIIDV